MLKRSAAIHIALVVAAVSLVTPAYAYTSFNGKVDMLEIWATGNAAFTLTPPATGLCNNQFIVNFSYPGARNLIATIITAKALNRPVTVSTYGCIAADGYGGSYIRVDYLYLRN